jgi:hypothetical protein
MKHTIGQKSAHGLLATALILLIAYGLISLLVALKFLGEDGLATSFPYQNMHGSAAVLAQLCIFSGLLGGGVYMALTARDDQDVAQPALLRWVYRLWLVLVILAVLGAALGLLEGRPSLELLVPFDIALLIFLVLFMWLILSSAAKNPPVIIWSVGILAGIIGVIVGLLPYASFEAEALQRVIASGIIEYISYPLAAVALAFWLMRRFSTVTPEWVDTGVFSCAGLIAVAGALLTVQPLVNILDNDLISTVMSFGVVLIPLAYLIYAAHLYHALSNRNTATTLAAHWLALGALCWVVTALFSAINALPDLQVYIAGTRLIEAQNVLFVFGVIAVILGAANQSSAELRGSSQRVTGLMPFWLVAFGALTSAVLLACAGVVQVFMERRASIGFLDVQMLIVPLYSLWTLALIVLLIGLVIYGLSFYLRRPREGAGEVSS